MWLSLFADSPGEKAQHCVNTGRAIDPDFFAEKCSKGDLVVTKYLLGIAAALCATQAGVAFADSRHVRISDVEIAIAARDCLTKGMALYVVRENGKPVATTCIVDVHRSSVVATTSF